MRDGGRESERIFIDNQEVTEGRQVQRPVGGRERQCDS
jgi:hypothetical protein